jgi:hypothetical protein
MQIFDQKDNRFYLNDEEQEGPLLPTSAGHVVEFCAL